MQTLERYLVAIICGGLVAGLGACGSTADVAARVGRTPINMSGVDHWAEVFAGPGRKPDAGLRQQALSYLISTQWVLGEASRSGLAVSEREVQAQYEQRKASEFPGGEREFLEFLSVSKRTPVDVLLETRRHLTTARLLSRVMADATAVTATQVSKYYWAHLRGFTIPEHRVFQIVVAHSKALAIKIKHEVEAGVSIEHFGETQSGDSNRLDTPGHLAGNTIEKLVFSGKPHKLLGPLLYHNVDFDLIEVKKTTPAREHSLDEVRGVIEKRLKNNAERRALARFVREWRLRWRAVTVCVAPAIISKCKHYPAVRALAQEDPDSFS